jgi:hypothetical protein
VAWTKDRCDRTVQAFSPDSRHLAISFADRTARIFVTADGAEELRIPSEYPVMALAFAPGGRYLVVASASYTADGDVPTKVAFERHALRAEDLIARVCARLESNLQPAEWHHFLPDERYPLHRPCPNLP